jgi:hypothetical protein
MKRWGILCLAVCVFSAGHAQGTYVGVGVSRVLWTTPLQYGIPLLPELQVGGHVAPEFGSFEIRASLGSLLLFSHIGVDALASFPFPEASLRLYLGGGPDVLVFLTGHSLQENSSVFPFFGLHGTVGLELLTQTIRPFLELQPAATYIDGEPIFGVRARAGMNFYF